MLINESFLKSALQNCSIISNSIAPNFYCTPSIDTRTLVPGQLFIAMKGEHSDGHDFLAEAVRKGAKAILIDISKKDLLKKIDESLLENVFIIMVSDVLRALVGLAKAWRNQFSYPVVGVTGSVGKTSTKEMIHSILNEAKIKACVSYGNQNTLVGLCINILRMEETHEVAVLEVGISQKGEMDKKVEILRPTMGVITFIGHSHIDGLGTVPEIVKEKKKLFKLLCEGEVGIICGDQPPLDRSFTHPVVRFGQRMKNQVQARKLKIFPGESGHPKISFILKLYKEKSPVVLKINHKGYVYNALAASSVAHQLKIPITKIVAGLENYNGFKGRFERRCLKNNFGWLIDDCYNANPESMREALLAVQDVSVSGSKIAVLGDMFELGEKEEFWHRQIGRVLGRTLSIKEIILVGDLAKHIGKTAPISTKIEYASGWKEAAEKLQSKLSGNDLVLVKASHAMSLENLVEHLCEPR
jgi:UDP-N-acetylmuramoyl-tripeptide--D-alanyl-D-alanine ligase